MNNALKRLVPRSVIKGVLPRLLKREAQREGLDLQLRGDHIDVIKGSAVVRISSDHAVYIRDIIASFDYYWGAVVPFKSAGRDIVDFSTPRYHDVIGFHDYPILFPSLAEPLVTANQYLDFAALADGMTVVDLGAYSGFTSILFSRSVGSTGTVVALEADARNVECIRRNFANSRKYSDGVPLLCEGAVWIDDRGLDFSSEGNMGSSAATIVGANRGVVSRVPTLTLSSITKRFNLTRLDFIKCDVEGAERMIFKDREFFQAFAPRIVIEPHVVDGVETSRECIQDLEAHGYRCATIVQHGVALPLIQCSPPAR
jgi:FkbM family methyltransferase